MRNPQENRLHSWLIFHIELLVYPRGAHRETPPCPGGHDFRHLCLFEVFPTLLQRQLPGQWGVGTAVTTIGSALINSTMFF